MTPTTVLQALTRIAELCPAYEGGYTPDCTPSDFGNPEDFMREMEAMRTARIGDIARAALSAPAQDAQADMPHFDESTSAGGRGCVEWFFVNVLKRHDFNRYIREALAADFACALAKWIKQNAARTQPATPVDAAATVPANYIVSIVMTKQVGIMVNTQNKLYGLAAVSPDEAHGKAIALAQADFPEHQFHTACYWPVSAATPPAAPQASSLPERDTTKPAEQQGLFRKFEVRRTDGSDRPGGKHHGCEYFVLDTDHDPAAKPALAAYADAIEATHKPLADDLRARYGLMSAQHAGMVPLTDAWIAAHLEQRGYVTKRGAVYGGIASPGDTPLYSIKRGTTPKEQQ